MNSVIDRPYYQHKKQRFEYYKTKADIVMVGDSITDGSEWHEMFPQLNIVNRGISGDTTVGVLNRLEGITQTQAKKAFIMIGVNGRFNDLRFMRIKLDWLLSQQ